MEKVKNENFVEFFENISIHSLRYMFGNNRFHRWVWWPLFLTMVGLSIWSGVNSVILYLKFDLSTSIEYKMEQELDFPAITFCNENVFERNKLGSTEDIMGLITNLFINASQQAKDENYKTCYVNKSHGQMDLQTMMTLNLNDLGMLVSVVSTSSDSNVLKCWWNNVEIECKGSFYNHIDSTGLCFTFNADEIAILEESEGKRGETMASLGYGLNSTSYKRKISMISGPNTGLQTLMNVDQPNYCGIVRKWHGAGFRSYVHDPLAIPSYFIDKPILLYPGVLTTVYIKPIIIRRQTEHLGKCVSNVDLPLTPVVSGKYVVTACLYECINILIYKKCNCTLFPVDNQQKKMAKLLNLQPGKVPPICLGPKMKCSIESTKLILTLNLETVCAKCKTPCFERKYEYQVSSVAYPISKWKNIITKDVNFYDKNLLIAQFSLESLHSTNILEQQAYTLIDVFIYLGGYIGLFLGMSFLSFIEIFQLVGYGVEIFWRQIQFNQKGKEKSKIVTFGKNRSNKRVRKVKMPKAANNPARNDEQKTVKFPCTNTRVVLIKEARPY